MSDASPEKPDTAAPASPPAEKPPETAAPGATATAEKPAAPAKPPEPAEPPFNVDILLSCTARYTNKAWYLFYNHQKDLRFIREAPLRATLEARTASGAEELHKLLLDAGVTQSSRQDKTVSFTGTFEQIQTVIKHPQAYKLDAIPL